MVSSALKHISRYIIDSYCYAPFGWTYHVRWEDAHSSDMPSKSLFSSFFFLDRLDGILLCMSSFSLLRSVAVVVQSPLESYFFPHLMLHTWLVLVFIMVHFNISAFIFLNAYYTILDTRDHDGVQCAYIIHLRHRVFTAYWQAFQNNLPRFDPENLHFSTLG